MMRYLKFFFVFIFFLALSRLALTQEKIELTLEECIEIALEKSKGLTLTEAKVKQAWARVGEARAAFLPQLGGRFTYTRLDMVPYISMAKFPMPIPGIPGRIEIGDDDNYNSILSVQQPLFTGFKIVNGYKVSVYGASAEEQNFNKTKAELILEVQKAYYNLLKAEELVKVSHQALEQMEAHVRDLENMYQVGLIAKNDLLKARVQHSNVNLMRIKAENGLKLANVALCSILGISLETQISPKSKLEYQPATVITLNEAIETALSKRPEIIAMRYNIKMADKAVSLARAQWLPNIFAVYNYNYKRPNREYEKKFYRSWDVTLALEWNLFDWGARYYQTSQAKQQLKQAETGFEQLKDGIILEVTQCYLALNEAQEKINATQINVGQAEENFRVTREKFNQGLATNTELLDANTLLTQAQMDYISALADYHIAQSSLKKAMGILVKTKEPYEE